MQATTENEKAICTFVRSCILGMAIGSALQRNPTYLKTATDKKKNEMKKAIRCKLISLAEQYKETVGEEKHKDNIVELSEAITQEFSGCLIKGCFRIGTSQKALNVYLKHLWSVGKIQEPPHFPIDRLILTKISNCRNIAWTQIDSMCVYSDIIEKARIEAKDRTLSVWELEEFNILIHQRSQ